jgi:hypothetical protein
MALRDEKTPWIFTQLRINFITLYSVNEFGWDDSDFNFVVVIIRILYKESRTNYPGDNSVILLDRTYG